MRDASEEVILDTLLLVLELAMFVRHSAVTSVNVPHGRDESHLPQKS
jgi:hypothetical protein